MRQEFQDPMKCSVLLAWCNKRFWFVAFLRAECNDTIPTTAQQTKVFEYNNLVESFKHMNATGQDNVILVYVYHDNDMCKI